MVSLGYLLSLVDFLPIVLHPPPAPSTLSPSSSPFASLLRLIYINAITDRFLLGVRKLEAVFGMMIAVMGISFGVEYVISSPSSV